MIYGIINAFIWAFSSIMYKKSLWETRNFLSDSMYQFLWAVFMLIFSIFWYIFLDFQIPNFLILILLISTGVLQIFSDLFEQFAYKNEKLSTLAPFWEFRSIITILLGFIIFQDTSLISFLFALSAWAILFAGNINPKTFQINKYCIAMWISGFLLALKMIIYGFILVEITPYNVFFYNILLVCLLLWIFVIYTKQLSQIKKFTPKAIKYFSLENIGRLIYTVIVLFLIKNLWVVQAILLWMLFLFASVAFARIFLKEKISKKQKIVLILVSICISAWVYFW